MASPAFNVANELLSIIAHELVFDDIRGAWKLRGISKAFKKAITDDIIMHQPKEVIQASSEIGNQFMPQYLYCRVKKQNDVEGAILVRLTKMNDYPGEKVGIKSE